MIEPTLEGRKVPWDHFLPVVPAGHQPLPGHELIGRHCRCMILQMHRLRHVHRLLPGFGLDSTITDRPLGQAGRYFKEFQKPPKGIPWERFALNLNADPASCKGCGVCAQVCPTDALKMVDK